MKDKEWLKKETEKLYKHDEAYLNPDDIVVENYQTVTSILELIDQLDEPEQVVCAENEHTTQLVEVPQFVGDWITSRKAGSNSLIWSLAYGQGTGKHEVLDWLCECSYADKIDREEKILKAWELGYTIEPPKTLQVIVKNYDSTVYKTDIPEDEAMKLIEGWKEDVK